jgi:hypothetical protein
MTTEEDEVNLAMTAPSRLVGNGEAIPSTITAESTNEFCGTDPATDEIANKIYKTRPWNEIRFEREKNPDSIAFPDDFPVGPFPDRFAAFAALKAWAANVNTGGGAFAVTREAFWSSSPHSRKGPRQLFRCNRYGKKRVHKAPGSTSPKSETLDRSNRLVESIKCNCQWAVYFEESDVGWVVSNYSESALKAEACHSHPLYQSVEEKNTNAALRHLPESLGITADLLHENGATLQQIYQFLLEHCRRSNVEANFVIVDIKNRLAGHAKKRHVTKRPFQESASLSNDVVQRNPMSHLQDVVHRSSSKPKMLMSAVMGIEKQATPSRLNRNMRHAKNENELENAQSFFRDIGVSKRDDTVDMLSCSEYSLMQAELGSDIDSQTDGKPSPI